MKQEVLNRVERAVILAAALSGLLTVAGTAAWALPPIFELLPNQERLEIVIKKSAIVRLLQPASRVSIVAPEIADVQILDPKQLLVTAQSAGETTLIIWAEDNSTRMIDVCVRWNTRMIQETLQSTMPDEAIRVLPMDDGVILQGDVHGIGSADTAVSIASSLAPKVINLLNAPGIHQVLLKVKVAEVARSFRKEMGVNFKLLDDNVQAANLLGGLVSGKINQEELSVSDAVSLFLGFPGADISVFIQAMQEKGVLRILAEPNLVARSGETATFLAGGEFPIPVVQGGGFSNAVTVEYKEFGVRLSFTPTVLSERAIRLDISPEVSDLDFAQGVSMGGYTIPAVITRRVHTVVALEDGQSFAIAGLISSSKQKNRRKIPMLGDIPMLGGLFRGGVISEKETELLVLVTPHLVAPIPEGRSYSMPGQYLEEPEKSPFLQDDGWEANPFRKEKEKTGTAEIPMQTDPIQAPAGGRKTLSPEEVRPVIIPVPPRSGNDPVPPANPFMPLDEHIPVEKSPDSVSDPVPQAQTSTGLRKVPDSEEALESTPASKSLSAPVPASPDPVPAAIPKEADGKNKAKKTGRGSAPDVKKNAKPAESEAAISHGVIPPERVRILEDVTIASEPLHPAPVPYVAAYTVTRNTYVPPVPWGSEKLSDPQSKPGFDPYRVPVQQSPRYEITAAGLVPIKPGFQRIALDQEKALETPAVPKNSYPMEPFLKNPRLPSSPLPGRGMDETVGIAFWEE